MNAKTYRRAPSPKNPEKPMRPDNPEEKAAEELVKIAETVRSNVAQLLKLNKWERNVKIMQKMKNCRVRIHDQLKHVATIRDKYNFDKASLEKVFRRTLSLVYKPGEEDEQIQEWVGILMREFKDDRTDTKVIFLRTYMEIVGRIPPEDMGWVFHK